MNKLFQILTFLIFHQNFNSAYNSAGKSRINQLISLNVELNYKPNTLRPLLSLNSSSSEHFDWELVSSISPVLLHPKKLPPELRAKFFSSTVIYFLLDTESFLTTLKHLEVETANRRWDKLVLIGKEEFLLDSKILNLLQGYRLKMGLAIDTSTFWVESKVFKPNGPLVPISDLSDYLLPPKMGSNLRERHFRVAGCEFPPWTLKIRFGKDQERVWGTHYEMVAFAANKFNFTFETNVLDGPNYGELHPNGTWTGMYAMIYYRDQNYDWCFMLGHDASWSAYVDYASTFGTIDLIFATGWPTAELKWTAMFEPLQMNVWLWTLASFIIISFFIYIFATVYVDYIQVPKMNVTQKTSSAKKLNFIDSFLMSYSILLEQGVEDLDGIKFLIALWLIFTIIFGTGYRSTLKSRLTFPSPEILPSNYKELAARSDFKIILNAQGVVEKSFFATTKIPEMINIKNRMFQEPSTENCVVAAFLEKHHACIGWHPYFKQTASATFTLFSGNEPLIYTKQVAHWNSLSMAFQKDSLFVDAFTPLTAALYETGIYNTWEEQVNNYYKDIGREKVLGDSKETRIYQKLVELSKEGENVAKPLKNKNFSVVYFILVFGWVFGIIVLIIETRIGKKKVVAKSRTKTIVPVKSAIEV